MATKNLPYTQMIIDKVIKEMETVVVEPVVSLSNPEFIAGTEYMKKEMLKKVKTKVFE